MRIQSRFKDYYDFVSNRYGADPGCVYVREPIENVEVEAGPAGAHLGRRLVRRTTPSRDEESLCFLVAGPHVFPVLRRYTRRVDPHTRDEQIVYRYEALAADDRRIERNTWRGDDAWVPPSKAQLDVLIRAVGAPVFLVRECLRTGLAREKLVYTAHIYEMVPVMSEMGIPTLVPASTMWQDIYTTLTTVLRHDPDKAVPVQLANNARIEKAGFDLKSSFRHPVNAKKVKAKR